MEESSCSSILVNNHLLLATTQSLHFWESLTGGSTVSNNCSPGFLLYYVVVDFLSQVIFVLHLFLSMVMYANKVETKEKENYLR